MQLYISSCMYDILIFIPVGGAELVSGSWDEDVLKMALLSRNIKLIIFHKLLEEGK